MLTTSVLAANSSVMTLVFNDAFFKVNDEVVANPSTLPVLNYGGSTYVPMRWLAETLGFEVQWDENKKLISVYSPEPQIKTEYIEKVVEKEVPVYVSEDEKPDGVTIYSDLPVSKSTSNYKVSVTGISTQDVDTTESVQGTRIYIEVINKSEINRYQLAQNSAVVKVDGKEYNMLKNNSMWDKGWYNDIQQKDDDSDSDEYAGYLVFDRFPENWKNASLTVTLRENGTTTATSEELTFNFKNDNYKDE